MPRTMPPDGAASSGCKPQWRAFQAALIVAATRLAGCVDPAPGDLSDVGRPDAWRPEVVAPDAASPEDTADSPARIAALTPGEGPTAGLTAVTLEGEGLASVRAVRFGVAEALDVFAISDRSVVLLTPPHPPGWVDVTIELGDGGTVTRTRGFLYRDPVGLTAVEPRAGSGLGGTPLTVRGAGFTDGVAVLIGGRRALDVAVLDPATLTCMSPEGTPGETDVLVVSPAGAARLARGYTFEADLAPALDGTAIDRVSPARGPAGGGTTVTLTGRGLGARLGVRVGATPARAVRASADGTSLTFVTPPGSPGPASIHLFDGAARTSAADAFTYVANAPALLAANPPRGAIAGGTRVELFGEGLPTTGLRTVTFGGREARLLAPPEGHRVIVEAPPGPVGATDVVLDYAAVTLTLPSGYTWFDSGTSAGSSGERASGALNLTVIETRTGDRVPGALTLVEGDALRGTLSCLTNATGQCVVSAAGLVGPLRVTVSAGGFQTVTIAGISAENLTVPVLRAFTCEDLAEYPCSQLGSPAASEVRVEVEGLDKGPTPAHGPCSDWRDIQAHCTPCVISPTTVASPCADGATCRTLGNEGGFCATPCTADVDCEAGFRCLDPDGGPEPRCVPPPPARVAFCNLTEVDPTDPKGLVWPGAAVDAEGQVTLDGRLGAMAVVCVGGHDVRGTFTPDVLGVQRGLEATGDGDVVEAVVTLDVALDARAVVSLDLPSLIRSGDFLASDRASFDAFLMLGGDGGVSFRTVVSTRAGPWEVAVPSRLSGPLADATWTVRGVVESPSRNGGAVVLEDNLRDLRSAWDREAGPDGAWTLTPATLPDLFAAARWDAAPGALVAVGDDGLILRREGRLWGRMGAGTQADLRAVASTLGPQGDVRAFAGGADGVITRWDGLRWQLVPTGTRDLVRGLAFLPSDASGRAVAVAGRTVLGWDGQAWTPLWQGTAELRAVAAGLETVWVVGDGGLAAVAERTDDGGLAPFAVVRTGVMAMLNGVVVGVDGGVDVVGANGTWLVGDVGGLRSLVTPATGAGLPDDASRLGRELTVVAVIDETIPAFPADAVAGGIDGALWHRVGDVVTAAIAGRHGAVARGTVRALVATPDGTDAGTVLALGSHDRVLGPFVGIPDDLSPPPGGTLGRTLAWTGAGLPPHFNTVEVRGVIGPCVVCGMQVLIPWVPWLTITRGDVTRADFHPTVTSFGLGFGRHEARITRIRTDPGYDFDDNAARGLIGGRQSAWAWRETTFTL